MPKMDIKCTVISRRFYDDCMITPSIEENLAVDGYIVDKKEDKVIELLEKKKNFEEAINFTSVIEKN